MIVLIVTQLLLIVLIILAGAIVLIVTQLQLTILDPMDVVAVTMATTTLPHRLSTLSLHQ